MKTNPFRRLTWSQSRDTEKLMTIGVKKTNKKGLLSPSNPL